MSKQSRSASLFESATNTVAGFITGIAVNGLLLPPLGYSITMTQNLFLVCVFTAASLVRGYLVRRFFERRRGMQ